MLTGPCITMRATNAQLLCDEDGNFEPLQCRRMNDGTHTCRCVHPRNGSMVAGTEVPRVTARDEAPDCESRGRNLMYNTQKPVMLIATTVLNLVAYMHDRLTLNVQFLFLCSVQKVQLQTRW